VYYALYLKQGTTINNPTRFTSPQMIPLNLGAEGSKLAMVVSTSFFIRNTLFVVVQMSSLYLKACHESQLNIRYKA